MTLQAQNLITSFMANQIIETANNNFIGMFLYGSQNYGLSYESSDIDTIVLVKEAPRPKTEIKTDYGKTKIYTFKYFLHRLKLGEIKCYEILYTNHKFINPSYEDAFNTFVQDFTKVLNINRIKQGLAIKLDEHLFHITWIMFDLKDGAKYNKKHTYWALRVYNQMLQLDNNVKLQNSFLYDGDIHEIIQIKTIVNYLPLPKLNKLMCEMFQYLKNQPNYNSSLSYEEERSLANFYDTIQKEGA